MAIDTISPVADSQLDPGDSFSFRVDDTYTSITIEVETAGGWEYAYDSSLSGAQAGYTVSVTVPVAGRHLFTVSRSAGWDLSPFSIRVVENETGSPATTTTNYTLYSANDYPQSADPYFLQSIGDSFLSHYDTPSTYSGKAGYYARVALTADAIEFVDLSNILVTTYVARAGNSVQQAAYMQTRADHVNTPSAGYGEFWVRSSDNKPIFTDPSGTDYNLLAGGGGGGDVVGPASATDNAVARFDTTTGKLLQNSSLYVDDVGTSLLLGSGAAHALAEVASVSPPGAGFGKYWVKNDIPSAPTFTNDTGGNIPLAERMHIVFAGRGAVASKPSYNRGPVGAPWTYQGFNDTSAGTTQGSPGTITVPSGSYVAPFAGRVVAIEGWAEYSNANLSGDFEFWKHEQVNGTADPATSTELCGSGGFHAITGTAVGQWEKISYTPSSNNTFAKGDFLEMMLFCDTGSSATFNGTPKFSITFTIERTA